MLVPITFQVVDSTTLTPLEGANVAVWDTNYETYLGGGLTNNAGELAIGLEAGTYTVFLLKEGFTFYPLPKTLGVEEDPLDVECKGVPVPSPVLASGYVFLHGTIKDITHNPSILPVYIHLNGTPQTTRDNSVVDRTTLTVCPDETGYWSVMLAGGTRVTVSIPGCQYQKSGVLPFSGSIEVNELGVYG